MGVQDTAVACTLRSYRYTQLGHAIGAFAVAQGARVGLAEVGGYVECELWKSLKKKTRDSLM